jgi:hypothetical protein
MLYFTRVIVSEPQLNDMIGFAFEWSHISIWEEQVANWFAEQWWWMELCVMLKEQGLLYRLFVYVGSDD